jgi:hypothetical protein
LILTEAGAVGRFVSENEQGQSDINPVSSSHVETVAKLVRVKEKKLEHENAG